MTDHFAVLDQPRRPWLDPDQLKRRYHELSFAHHPDREEQSAAVDFACVTEAYRVLSNPKLRLHHLLELENKIAGATSESGVTADLSDTFMETAALFREIDELLEKRQRANNAITKSLLEPETASTKQRAQHLAAKLQNLIDNTEGDVRRADEQWMVDRAHINSELPALAQRFGYLERWITQLKERQFQLSS